jgi:hypothetical protein
MSLIYPDDWHDASKAILARTTSTAMRVVVVGSKNTGKSSFIRFLSRKLLDAGQSQVFTMETDCGQPENTPPGIISISRRFQEAPQKVHDEITCQRYLGFVNPAADPIRYMRTVESVHDDFPSTSSALLVNCHGFGTSVGRETWEAIIRVVQPNYVVFVGSEVQEPIEMTSGGASLLDREYPTTTPEWLYVSRVIASTDPSNPHPHQATGPDYRWMKFADHFRPELRVSHAYKACHPSEFFSYPYTALLELETKNLQYSFPTRDPSPREPLRAIVCTVAALLADKEFVCMAYIARVTSDSISAIIPPNIFKSKIEKINTIARGSIDWSPRDPITFGGKTSSYPFIEEDEPYFLSNVLTGDFGNVASGRNDLKRKRLQN